ncbi:DUF58 domain-containing protein [Fodinicola feengrottensis]|uniref:DUF58 domain-containing protein n=1 Tax=Fodinicola feengrottensis TaxID=435914 RepID=A0ABN2HRS3_9ACTN|nr:DUF58 domain-containing protein [Fodinicola feengrottensis]
MFSALRGLTLRGRSFLAAGIASAVCALILGENDLLRVAVLLILLPILSSLAVARTRYLMSCRRTLSPDRVPAGKPVKVTLTVENTSRLPTGVLLLEEQLPYALGSRPRFVLDRLWSRQSARVSYQARADVRGHYQLGPLQVRVTDPFGLCALNKSFTGTERLSVIPAAKPLPAVQLTGQRQGTGDNRGRTAAVHGEDDAATREYRIGDDLRKVHWKSTARVGALMVRREEQPWHSRASLLLDTRAIGHRGDGPGSSFEWSVSAVASMAVHLYGRGYTLKTVTDIGTEVETSRHSTDGPLMDLLAGARLSHQRHFTDGVTRLRKHGGDGVLIAVLGLLDDEAAAELANLSQGGRPCAALLLDTTTWTRQAGETEMVATREAYDLSVQLLRGAGWKVVEAGHGDPLEKLWRQVTTWSGRGGSTLELPTASGIEGPR